MASWFTRIKLCPVQKLRLQCVQVTDVVPRGLRLWQPRQSQRDKKKGDNKTEQKKHTHTIAQITTTKRDLELTTETKTKSGQTTAIDSTVQKAPPLPETKRKETVFLYLINVAAFV